jgi:hypothetical protein
MNKLSARIIPAATAGDDLVEEMFALMHAHYDGVNAATLRADLAAKDFIILLERDGRLRGFSTQAVTAHAGPGGPARVVFSGDTIIDRADWGSPALALAWGRMMLGLLDEAPDHPLHWLLTTKGYKTYRFLTVFFRDFLPHHDRPADPAALALRDTLAHARFGDRYDPRRGLLPAAAGAQRLRPGVADLPDARLRDPHLAHFQALNPGHAQGDELVCLARFHPANLHPHILRRLRAGP